MGNPQTNMGNPQRSLRVTHVVWHFFVLQKQVEGLEVSIREKEHLYTQLQGSLSETKTQVVRPSVQTADIGVQSHRTEEQAPPSPSPTHSEAGLKHSTPAAAGVKVRSSDKRFSKERIRSPVRRIHLHSPRTSSGDLLDSSLDNEMRAAGVDINDSFDSSEGVGFSDTNLDISVQGSDLSLVNKEDGDLSATAMASSEPQRRLQVEPPHRMAWGEIHSDQAQATMGSDHTERSPGGLGGLDSKGGPGEVALVGQEDLNNLVEGVRGGEDVGESGLGLDGEAGAASSHDRGKLV